MDQEEKMDFQALRAKFQDEELLKQPRMKPALPEKPKVVPPPQSPPHYLPAGARPSLLTSINQTLDRKSMMAPRVVFKDEKKESKKPLIPTNTKGKDKSEGKVKKSKDKTSKGSKEKPEDGSSDQKQKKENGKDKRFSLMLPGTPKENTAELVPATPPPKTATKKGFLGFRKSAKKDSAEILADPIMDAPSSDVPGQAPLIPVPSLPEITLETTPPKALLPNLPILPDSTAAVEVTPPSTIPASPDFTPPPAFIPDIPASQVPESETPLVTETPALPASRPASQNEIIPDPPSTAPTPPPSATSDPSPVASSPSPPPPDPDTAAEAVAEAVNIEPPPSPPSPKVARPISALSALSRAEELSPVKKTSLCDQRIFNALEKARRKTTSPISNSSLSNPVTPPPEECPPSESPTSSIPDLPPIDYEDRAGNAHPKPELVNGFDHRQASPELEGITEERPDPVPELLVVPPPPPPRMVLPDPESLGPPPEKPSRPPSVSLKEFIPPAPAGEENEIPAPPEFSEAVTADIQEFTKEPSPLEIQTPEVPVSDWGNGDYPGPDTVEGQDPPEFYSNDKTAPPAGVDVASTFDDQDAAQVEATSQTIDSPPQHELQDQTDNGVHESSENVYEDITTSATKKKGKTDGGKKRKGPPKNPYAAEPAQETIEEKSKTGRFGKSDKKAAAEGPDEKELKKKEKQRLEKEKKELKEKQEREKKEQKEKEKKENEMKKKFKITGQEDAMYQAKVTVTTKGRKNDLPVKDGDIISIIRTTNCPKGKWLARDDSSNYGYVAVDHVELDIKEMLELGKKAVNNNKSISSLSDVDVPRAGSRTSNHYPLSPASFSDDSEEWTGDDDEPLSPARGTDPFIPTGHTRTLSMPDMGIKDVSINHQHSRSDINPDGSHNQARHEALHKLTTFFYAPKPVEPASTEPETNPALVKEEAAYQPEAAAGQDLDLDQSDIILPPPDLYADMTVE